MPSALFVTTVPITLEAFLLPFAELLRDEGWRVEAMASGAPAHQPIIGKFHRLHTITWSRNPLSPGNLGPAARRVREVVGRGAFDVVHVHTPIAAFVTRWALREFDESVRPTIIYTAHGFHFYEGQPRLSNFMFKALERWAARWTDILVTINDEDFRAARAFKGIDPSDVRFIAGIGVDTELFSPLALSRNGCLELRSSLGIARNEHMITMVAEFSPVKRHTLALKAFANVGDPDAILVLVGEGPLLNRVRAEAERLGVASRTRFLGYRTDVDIILCSSDVALLTSEREGLPRSILEAMACGTPAVGTYTRGIIDAIGDRSLIADHNDSDELARIIRTLLDDPERRQAAGKAARARVLDKFGLSRILDAYQAVYAEALERRDDRARPGGDYR